MKKVKVPIVYNNNWTQEDMINNIEIMKNKLEKNRNKFYKVISFPNIKPNIEKGLLFGTTILKEI